MKIEITISENKTILVNGHISEYYPDGTCYIKDWDSRFEFLGLVSYGKSYICDCAYVNILKS